MGAKKIYTILGIFLGYGLIIGGFTILGESLECEVKILDIVVSCIVLTQFVQFLLFPLVNLDKPAHKEVGMMGIHMFALSVYCLFSMAFIVWSIVNQIQFKYQLMGHLALFLILIMGRVATLHSGVKVQQIYEKEQIIVGGKMVLQNVMNDLMDEVPASQQIDESIKCRILSLCDSCRYLSPTSNADAKNLEYQFVQSVKNLKVLMKNTTLNKEKIFEEIDNLERILSRRKRY